MNSDNKILKAVVSYRNGKRIEKYLIDGGFKKETSKAFRQLFDFVEWDEPISKSLLKKFENCGIYFPKEKKICDFEDGAGVILNALIFEGMVKKKLDGIEYPRTPITC